MLVLINFTPSALKVEYTDNNKSFFKHIPTNSFVTLKNLYDFSQIANDDFLIKHADCTIYNFVTNTYLNRNGSTPSTASFPFVFIDNNVKPSDEVTFTKNNNSSGLTAGYNQLKTLFNA